MDDKNRQRGSSAPDAAITPNLSTLGCCALVSLVQ